MMLSAIKVVAAFLTIHLWYENACCADQDCHPVEDGVVTEGRDGVEVQGFGTLSYTDSRLRWSQDNRDHLCVSNIHKLICVYRKPKWM